MQSIQSTDYLVNFNSQGYQKLTDLIIKIKPSSIVILVDENTKKHCLPLFLNCFSSKVKQHLIEIPAGEENKTIKTCLSLWNRFAELNIDRTSLVINLGGGMLTDLGGFVAATYKRGIDFINIPTTLLSMVDASVGGKTGVDLGSLKNLVGLFANPKMVLIDTSYLKTVSKRELNSGMAEIIKYGLTYDVSLWNTIQTSKELNNEQLDDLIHRSIQIKNEVVLQDPKEQSLRKILNFGHTIGHAIESYFLEHPNKQKLTHGHAIAIGMVCECYMSYKQLNFPMPEVRILKDFVVKTYGKIDLQSSDFSPILELLKYDKKNIGTQINFVLLNAIEDYKIDCQVSNDLILESLKYYLG